MPRTRTAPAASITVPPVDVDQRIARRLAEMRAERGLTLDMLSARSGVSRAMISKVERVQASPTAAVLNKLAIGLGVSLPSLLGFSVQGPPQPLSPITRRKDQRSWRDPESGYRRRTLTPPEVSQPMRLSEVHFPPKAVAFENASGSRVVYQQIWMLSGQMRLSLGGKVHNLAAGDCIAMAPDQPVRFHNPGQSSAHYLVATSQDIAGQAAR